MSASEFIRHKYGTEFSGYLSVWDRRTGRTSYFSASEREALDNYIAVCAAAADVYVALGLQAERLEPHRRGKSESVIALPGFVADVDFADAKNSAKRYPKDEAEALAIISTFIFPPSAIVRTGNGLHVHWELNALHECRTEEERVSAKRMWTGFQRFLADHFKKNGREIDSVGDLTRNYRVPGTLNHKTTPPRSVELLECHPERRYALADIEAALGDLTASPANAQKPDRENTPADHAAIVEECSWYRNVVVNGAATCGEPDWYAGASITARCRDGERIFHEYSSRHPGYDQSEATNKLRHALADAGPRTCASIDADLGHAGCATCVHMGGITSPIQLGSGRRIYDPGDNGPIPIGYNREGLYVLHDPVRKIIVYASGNQLLSMQYLVGLAPSDFWRSRFPAQKLFNQMAAGEALIAACRRAGPFSPAKVRGRGIWLEGDRIIQNLGAPVPEGTTYRYLCFEPIRLDGTIGFGPQRLLELLQRFNWKNPKDATLLLGWLALAPICGVLGWRPHVFVHGPARSGKTTIHVVARQILWPLVVSTEGSSSEAGIRQTIGPDSLPVIIDEFESDHAIPQLRSIVRLARSASSAENPILRGTPEGRAMQFSLRTTFFFCAVNPVGMSPADESRIVLLELLMHENDTNVAQAIREDEVFFRDKGPGWCSYMISLAPEIPPAVEVLERAMPSGDRRHRQNMATLLAGAFVALHGRPPTEEEAQELANEFAGTVEVHAEALDRDDARECLDHLFAYVVERFPLGHWLGVVHLKRDGDGNHLIDAIRVTGTFGFAVRTEGNEPGLFIRNGSPGIEKVYIGTRWADRAWMRALRKLDGAVTTKNTIYFSNVGEGEQHKHRAIGIPLDVIPEPFASPADEERF